MVTMVTVISYNLFNYRSNTFDSLLVTMSSINLPISFRLDMFSTGTGSPDTYHGILAFQYLHPSGIMYSMLCITCSSGSHNTVMRSWYNDKITWYGNLLMVKVKMTFYPLPCISFGHTLSMTTFKLSWQQVYYTTPLEKHIQILQPGARFPTLGLLLLACPHSIRSGN